MKIFGKINLKYYMSLSVLSYIHVPLFNIDMSLFCIDMNIEAHFYRYIDISDINDSSSIFHNNSPFSSTEGIGKPFFSTCEQATNREIMIK